ncbi:MAG: hypothetical protein K0V04_36555 [Deltaproteobacteria bacterium]|nr:hypothetical protein [Deltaproteobacteria bacterium]
MKNQFDPARLTVGLAVAMALGNATGCSSGDNGGVAVQGPQYPQGDGGEDGSGTGDDDPAREPVDPDAEPPFQVPNEEARLLPFPVRMHNLAHVTGQSLDHPMYAELYELRYQLGDHDFAEGVAPDLRWSAERMQYWVRGLRSVCSDPQTQAAYAGLLADPRPMMRAAWGRDPVDEEVEAIQQLRGPAVLPADEAMMTCIAVLTALDFVAI